MANVNRAVFFWGGLPSNTNFNDENLLGLHFEKKTK